MGSRRRVRRYLTATDTVFITVRQDACRVRALLLRGLRRTPMIFVLACLPAHFCDTSACKRSFARSAQSPSASHPPPRALTVCLSVRAGFSVPDLLLGGVIGVPTSRRASLVRSGAVRARKILRLPAQAHPLPPCHRAAVLVSMGHTARAPCSGGVFSRGGVCTLCDIHLIGLSDDLNQSLVRWRNR